MVVVLGNDVVGALCLGQLVSAFGRSPEGKFALAVGYPQAQLVAAQRAEHDAVVQGYLQRDEFRLELVTVVVQHLGPCGAGESQFHHQLATVADAERQGVLAGVELVQRLLGLGVEEEGTGPSLGRAQHVAVGEAAAEDNHVDILQRLATTDEVGHHHVLDVEAGQIERIGHLTLAVGTLLADDGCPDAALLPAVGRQAVLAEHAGEVAVELHLQGLLLIVLVALTGLAVEALLGVQQVGGLIPGVAQRVDVERQLLLAGLDNQRAAVLYGVAYLGVADALLVHEFGKVLLVGVADFHHDAGILGKERLHHVAVLAEVVQVDVHAALGVGEAHLQQGGNQTAGRDVVSGHDPSFVYQLLNGHEGVGEVFYILHRRHVAAHLAEALRKG